MRLIRWSILALLIAAIAAAGWAVQQRRLASPIARYLGPAVTSGPLSERPALFATSVYRLLPTTVEAVQGRLTVAQNRVRPDGRMVDLHFLRFAALTNDPGATTFYLEDGPGAAASRTVAGRRFAFLQQLRAAGDVVVTDQRGTHYSPPTLQCTTPLEFPLDDEATLPGRAALLAPYLRNCARELAPEADLATFNTRESARDLDELRQALGLDQINLVGVGYGSQLALEYVRLFPDRVLSAVLMGVEAPHQVYKLPTHVDAALERVGAAAAERYPNLLADILDVLAALDAAAVHVALDIPERAEVVLGRMDVEAWLYSALASRAGIGTIPRGVGRMLQGDYRDIALAVAQSRASAALSLLPVAVSCSAGASLGRRERIEVEAEMAVLRYFPQAPLLATCGAWTGGMLPDDFRQPIESEAYVLAVSGTLDVHTSIEAAEEALEGFPNAIHLIVDGAARGDDLLVEARAVGELVVQFLRQEQLSVDRVVLGPISFLAP